MQASAYLYRNGIFETETMAHAPERKYQLVLGFGKKELLANESVYTVIVNKFPGAELLLCSTAGEIYGAEVLDDAISFTAIAFDKTALQTTSVNVADYSSSYEAGAQLVKALDRPGLKNIFVLSDGGVVNGSELVQGMESIIRHNVPITGGLAGDGTKFESTVVGLNALPRAGVIAAVGFYGNHLKVTHGSMGGWEVFGLERTVTRSVANMLYEIDHTNALALYRQYLGKYADDLPGSALLFPLSVQLPGSSEEVVRTILSINPKDNSMVFAGDVPEGSKVRFMKANFDNLVDAASLAARDSLEPFGQKSPALAILISCVGRKIILGKRVDEEVEAVIGTLGKNTIVTGFYSYGELSPLKPGSSCQLHNQTMTITTLNEE